jgi:hypothetical protein
MPKIPTWDYSDNSLEHRDAGDSLGQLQGLVVMGKLEMKNGKIVTKWDQGHGYFSGFELKQYDDTKVWGGYYVKKDCAAVTGSKGGSGRSTNRVVVRLTLQLALVEDWAVFWRHDNRCLLLQKGFFERAKTYRDMQTKGF